MIKKETSDTHRIGSLRPFLHNPIGNNIPYAKLAIKTPANIISVVCGVELHRGDDVRVAKKLETFGPRNVPQTDRFVRTGG